MPQRSIPYMQLRGGSSKGLYFKAEDLPAEQSDKDQILLAAMCGAGAGDERQIDGLGGADPLTSKTAIVGLSEREDADLDYEFVQVVVGKGVTDRVQNCGNILAGVVPFAIEAGLLEAGKGAMTGTTTARVHMVNSGSVCEVVIQTTTDGQVQYGGETVIDGVPGSAAPVICNYMDTAGSATGRLLSTGNLIDVVDDIEITCIDNGMPVVLMRAEDFGLSGYESRDQLNADEELKTRLESIRLQIGPKMNLGDVKDKVVPKMTLISKPVDGGLINTRTFIPHVCHAAIGVLGAVSVATACVIPGTVADGIADTDSSPESFSVEHPSGEFSVSLELDQSADIPVVKKAGLLRTARLLSRGEVFIPE